MYQWENQINKKPLKNLSKFQSTFGYSVTKRDAKGRASSIRFNLYVARKFARVKIIGPFNNWGKQVDGRSFYLKPDKSFEFYSIDLNASEIKHKDPYLFHVNGQYLRDPASKYFDSKGNSVFWDFEDPSTYKIKHSTLFSPGESYRVLQSDLPGLIMNFQNKIGTYGREVDPKDYYKFITNSGVIKRIKELGFNAIQFLPVAQSIDGAKWNLRYLVPFLHSINSYWGNPDDFRCMVDTFHKHKIAFIVDSVVSHAPHKSFRLFNMPDADVGIHHWKNSYGKDLYLKDETPWGTKRYRLKNPLIQKFIIESVINQTKDYNVDGFRIDNVDGILRYGINGDEKERPHGREFLQTLIAETYNYKPQTLFHLESHYFYGDNAKWLVQDQREDNKALGATAYTSSRLTYYFHTEFMPFSGDKISGWTIKSNFEEKIQGQSASTIADFHNHDAASGLIEMRATGSYAYHALTLGKKKLHYHAIGKILVMEALVSFAAEGRTLDLLQTFLLQKDSFDHNTTIAWENLDDQEVRWIVEYKKNINLLLSNKAFWPINQKNKQIINVDDSTQTLTIRAFSKKEKEFIMVIHLSSITSKDLLVPVSDRGEYKLIFEASVAKLQHNTQIMRSKKVTPKRVTQFEYFRYGIEIKELEPYHIMVFQKS